MICLLYKLAVWDPWCSCIFVSRSTWLWIYCKMCQTGWKASHSTVSCLLPVMYLCLYFSCPTGILKVGLICGMPGSHFFPSSIIIFFHFPRKSWLQWISVVFCLLLMHLSDRSWILSISWCQSVFVIAILLLLVLHLFSQVVSIMSWLFIYPKFSNCQVLVFCITSLFMTVIQGWPNCGLQTTRTVEV